MLKERSIGLELISMLIISLAFHFSIIAILIFHTKVASRIKISKEEKLDFMLVTTVNKSLLKEYKNKLPPPIVRPETQTKALKKAKIVQKKKKKSQIPKEKDKKRKAKERTKEAIAKALSNIYSELEKKPAPRANNYNLKDFESQGTSPFGTRGAIPDSQKAREIYQYKKNIQAVLINNWHIINKSLIKSLRNPVVILSIKIDKEGNILNYKFVKNSGNRYYDRSVLRAVEKSDPLPPPPENLAKEVISDVIVLEFSPPIN